jgi:hypothetical protein
MSRVHGPGPGVCPVAGAGLLTTSRAGQGAAGRPAGAHGGFGAVALRIFPDPVTGHYKSPSWQAPGDELQGLLTPEADRASRLPDARACPAGARRIGKGGRLTVSFGPAPRQAGERRDDRFPMTDLFGLILG